MKKTLPFVLLPLLLASVANTAWAKIYRCTGSDGKAPEYITSATEAEARNCKELQGGNIDIVKPIIKIKPIIKEKIQGTTINASNINQLKEEKNSNGIKFEQDYKNFSFSSLAKFQSAMYADTLLRSEENGKLSGEYLISFNANGVKITCVTASQKILDYAAKLKFGDTAKIDAKFNANNLINYGFAFRDCDISKPN